MSLDIQDFYKSITSAGFIEANTHGRYDYVIRTATGDPTIIPMEIDGKRVIKYSPGVQAEKGETIFHPLKENIIGAESPALVSYRKAVNVRFQYSLIHLLTQIFTFGADAATHSRATVEQSDLLIALKDVTEDFLTKKWKKICEAIEASVASGESTHRIVHCFLKRRAVHNGRQYGRLAVVSFPLYEQICSTEQKVFGVTLSKKERATIKSVLEWVFPDIATPGEYNVGSNSDMVPFLDALLGVIENIGGHINDSIRKMGLLMDSPGLYQYDLSFIEARQNGYVDFIDDIRGSRPVTQVQAPAAPVAAVPPKAAAQALATPVPVATPSQPAQQAPVSSKPSTPQKSWADIVRERNEKIGVPAAPQVTMVPAVQQAMPQQMQFVRGQDGQLYQVPVQAMAPTAHINPRYAGAIAPVQQQAQQVWPGIVTSNAGQPVAQQAPVQQQMPPVGVPVAFNQMNQPIDAYGNVCMMQTPQMPMQGTMMPGVGYYPGTAYQPRSLRG